MKIANIFVRFPGVILALVLLLVPPSLNPLGKSFSTNLSPRHTMAEENQTVNKYLVGIQEETQQSFARTSFLAIFASTVFVSLLPASSAGSSGVLAAVRSSHRPSRVYRV